MTSVEIVPALTDVERVRLADLEIAIERDLAAFVKVGLTLRTIRDEGLYRDVLPPTFEAYCQQRWDLSYSRAWQIIDSARIALATSSMEEVAPVPNERIARVLTPFFDRESESQPDLLDVWTKVTVAVGDEPLTAKRVREALVRAGYIPDDRDRATGGKLNRSVLLGKVGDRVAKALERLERFARREMGDQPVDKRTRDQAARYAGYCRSMAELLDAIAAGEPLDEPRAAVEQQLKTVAR